MAETFIKRTVRLAFTPGTTESLKTTGGVEASVWQGAGCKFEVTFLKEMDDGSVELFDISNIASPVLYIYLVLSPNTVLIGPVSPAVTDAALTLAEYAAGGYHFQFNITAAEANVSGIAGASGRHYFRLQGYTSDSGTDLDVFGRGLITFVDPGDTSPGAAPAPALAYPGYDEFVAQIRNIAREEAWRAMKLGIPDNIEAPAKRRILDVASDGTPIDDIVNP